MRPLKLTEEIYKQILQDFETTLRSNTAGSTRISYNKALDEAITPISTGKIQLKFTCDAYMKMMCLTSANDKEVGWHGVVDRISDTEFLVSEILVFPQIVSGVTVTPDAEEYAMWTMSIEDDVFNKIRFHGHSHVRMMTSPSGTDDTYRADMTCNIRDDDYYIFLITNHDAKHSVIIYDFKNNRAYDTADIEITLMASDGTDIKDWVTEKNKLVRTQVITTPAQTQMSIASSEAEASEGFKQWQKREEERKERERAARAKQSAKNMNHNDSYGYDSKKKKWFIINPRGGRVYMSHKPTPKEVQILRGKH